MTTTTVLRVRAVLTRHGIDPDAGVGELTALLEARGWRVSLEQATGAGGVGRLPRWSARATLAPPPGSHALRTPEYRSASGPDGRDALARIVARVLEREA